MELKVNRSKFLFYIGLLLYVSLYFYKSTVFAASIPNSLDNIIRLSAVILFIIKIYFNDRFSIKEIIIYMIILTISIFIVVQTHYFVVFDILIVTLSSKGINFNTIVKIVFTYVLSLTILTIILSIFGKIDNIQYVRNGKVRNSFGMSYTTILGARIFYLIIMYCYIKRNSFKIYDYILLIIIAIWVDKMCDARLSVVTIILMVISMLIYSLLKDKSLKNYKLFSFLMVYSPVIAAIFTVVTSYFYSPNNKYFLFLDKLLSTRLQLGKQAFNNYSVKLFGQNIQMYGNGGYSNREVGYKYFFIDSSYLYALFCYGLVFLIIYLIITTLFLKKCYKQNNLFLLIVFSVIAISNIVGEDLFNVSFNIFTLAICAYIPIKENSEST